MEMKTKLDYEPGKHDIVITREFELPLELLFKAYEDAELIEQWMGNRVIKLENKRHGSYQFETTDPKGNLHAFNGTIHEFVPNKKITRTFEMENTPFPVQLEFLEFEAIDEERSFLRMIIIYKSVFHRDEMLKMPFKQGINWAHNRLEEVIIKLKNAK